MNFELTQEQRSMVNTVRELTQDKFKPNALKYMDGTFPWDNIRDLAKIGVLGMAVPEEYGGLGLPVLDTALVLEEIAKGCYVTAMAVLGDAVRLPRITNASWPRSGTSCASSTRHGRASSRPLTRNAAGWSGTSTMGRSNGHWRCSWR